MNARKLHAVEGCKRLNATDPTDEKACDAAIRNLFGAPGANPAVLPTFACDNGRSIRAGDNFLANYNVTILDIAPVTIGDHVMIGPGTLITTVNHPLSPTQRTHRTGNASHHRQRCVDRRQCYDSARSNDRQQCRDRGRCLPKTFPTIAL